MRNLLDNAATRNTRKKANSKPNYGQISEEKLSIEETRAFSLSEKLDFALRNGAIYHAIDK